MLLTHGLCQLTLFMPIMGLVDGFEARKHCYVWGRKAENFVRQN